MSKAKICAPLAVLLLCLQQFSYSQNSIVHPGEAALSADPVLDTYGNLLFFKTVVSKTTGVGTEVTLISPAAKTTTETYPGIFSSIKRGEEAVYAMERVPAASPVGSLTASNSATLSLVALVTGPGSLPNGLIEYPLSGRIELLKIAPGIGPGGSDVIYLRQKSSLGPSVLVLTFDGTVFTTVGTVPLS